MKKKFIIMGWLLLIGSYSRAQQDTIVYRKPLFGFDPTQPTFKLEGEQLSNSNRFLRFFTTSGYREGVPSTIGPFGFKGNWENDLTAGTSRYYCVNRSIEEILTQGLKPQSKVILEVKNPKMYRYDSDHGPELELMRKYARCVELTVPIGVFGNFSPTQRLLEYAFGVETFTEDRLVQVYVLKRSSDKDKIKSMGAGQYLDLERGKFTNASLGWITEAVKQYYIVIDETGYKSTVDLDLQISNWRDIPAVQRALARYDLNLTTEKRMQGMFVIREVKK